MNDKKIQSLEDIRASLAGTTQMEFSSGQNTHAASRWKYLSSPPKRFLQQTDPSARFPVFVATGNNSAMSLP